jgi:hypothetical protein
MLLPQSDKSTKSTSTTTFGTIIKSFEEAIRFLKNQVNLEKIRTFRLSAISRFVLLAMLVMIYLGRLLKVHPNISGR